jgi:hypothetical protein
VSERCVVCGLEAEPGSPVALCTRHLLAAHDWVVREVGASDLLPAPCAACGSRLGVRYPAGWICAVCEWKVGDVPDDGAVDVRVDVIYYLRYGDRIKIGTSGNPRRRIASLPHDEVLGFERGGRALEQRRHAQFSLYRIPHTEWFESHDALLNHVAEVGSAGTDPWALYDYWLSRAIALRAG